MSRRDDPGGMQAPPSRSAHDLRAARLRDAVGGDDEQWRRDGSGEFRRRLHPGDGAHVRHGRHVPVIIVTAEQDPSLEKQIQEVKRKVAEYGKKVASRKVDKVEAAKELGLVRLGIKKDNGNGDEFIARV